MTLNSFIFVGYGNNFNSNFVIHIMDFIFEHFSEIALRFLLQNPNGDK